MVNYIRTHFGNHYTDKVTAAEVKVKGREFLVRQYLTGYQLRGDHAPACDEQCQGFLQNWIAAGWGGDSNTNLPELPDSPIRASEGWLSRSVSGLHKSIFWTN